MTTAEESPHSGLRALSNKLRTLAAIVDYNGGKLVKSITLLKAGAWRDSNVQSVLNYSPTVLSKYANNWSSRQLWYVHTTGQQRPITALVGEVLNPYFDPSSDELKGDLFFHMATTDSKDTFNLVKAGMDGTIDPVSFSIEHLGDESYNAATRQYQADNLEFIGGAIVPLGASAGTKILSHYSYIETQTGEIKAVGVAGQNDEGAQQPGEDQEATVMEEKDIKELIAKELANVLDSIKELSGKYDTLGTSIKELSTVGLTEDKVKELISTSLTAVSKTVEETKEKVTELAKVVSKPRALAQSEGNVEYIPEIYVNDDGYVVGV